MIATETIGTIVIPVNLTEKAAIVASAPIEMTEVAAATVAIPNVLVTL